MTVPKISTLTSSATMSVMTQTGNDLRPVIRSTPVGDLTNCLKLEEASRSCISSRAFEQANQ
ncbi:hypothetical protein J6590_097857 [Homalodisca vitripennis]|nr:hypothetical protein J6590_097857 [Homalodisca vitripennis]